MDTKDKLTFLQSMVVNHEIINFVDTHKGSFIASQLFQSENKIILHYLDKENNQYHIHQHFHFENNFENNDSLQVNLSYFYVIDDIGNKLKTLDNSEFFNMHKATKENIAHSIQIMQPRRYFYLYSMSALDLQVIDFLPEMGRYMRNSGCLHLVDRGQIKKEFLMDIVKKNQVN